jgi:hypothetical protein
MNLKDSDKLLNSDRLFNYVLFLEVVYKRLIKIRGLFKSDIYVLEYVSE